MTKDDRKKAALIRLRALLPMLGRKLDHDFRRLSSHEDRVRNALSFAELADEVVNCGDVHGLDENRYLQHCNDQNELHRLRAIVSGKTFNGEMPIVVEEERDQLRAALKRVREVLSRWSDLGKAHEYGCGNNRPCDACEIDELLTKLAR